MGTNFYVHAAPSCGGKCSVHCKPEEIHLGKSSGGWAFTFRAYPDPDYSPEAVTWRVTDYETWLQLLDLGEIRDEYGRVHTPAELVERIDGKRDGRHHIPDPTYGHSRDDAGNDFIATEFS